MKWINKFYANVCLVFTVANYPARFAFGKGGGALCISCMFGQQAVFETRCTPMVTQLMQTVNVNNFGLVERTFWQGFNAELAIQKIFFFIHLCSRRFVSACHPQPYFCTASRFPKVWSRLKMHRFIACQKISGVERNLH